MGYTMTRDQAEQKGKELLNQLKGNGWSIRVWETMGWDGKYAAELGGMTISPSYIKDTYYALLGDGKYGGGNGFAFWTDNFYSKDPNKAVKHQLKLAQKFVDECQELIDKVKNNI